MKPWIIDAATFLEHSEFSNIEKDDLITTNDINMFFDADDIHFIIAPKGFGKTLLLIYKRLLYKFYGKVGFKFIPSDSLVDLPKSGVANLDWGKLMIDFYQDRQNWEGLWRASISLSIIQTIKKSSLDAGSILKEDSKKLEMIRKDTSGLRYPLLRKLIYEEVYETPLAYINHILSSFGRNDVKLLLKEQEFMDELISEIHNPIAIFIDNVDEYFEEHPEKDKQDDYSPSVRGIFDIRMWHVSQQGLMFAVKTMCRSNHHLDIFVSVRKEAYEKLSGTTVENLRGKCLDVLYSSAKLKEIFERNIKWTDRKYLLKPEKINTEPIISLLGFNELKNESTKEDEDVFKYIYRHTLKRPRDIIAIGRALVKIDNEERTKENVRIQINKVATQIATDYIEIFFPHTCFDNKSKVQDLFKLIPHNILTLENLKDICSCFNGGCDNKQDCKKCDKMHVFCDLYKLGLLGIVKFNTDHNKFEQKFLRPGELTFESHMLPTDEASDSDYYLIHPILNGLIGGRPETQINKTITIGDGKYWTKPELPDFLTKKYKMFLCHSSDDKVFVDKLANGIQGSAIYLWYDKWNIKVGDSIVDEIDKGIKESEYLGIVISSKSLESGWVKKELNVAIMAELEKKKVVVLPILIEDVWDKVPNFLIEKKYADFRTSYEEGLEELLDKIKI